MKTPKREIVPKEFRNREWVANTLLQNLKDGDAEAFKHNLRQHLCFNGKEQFATAVGFSNRSLRRLQSPDGNPTLKQIVALFEALKVPNPSPFAMHKRIEAGPNPEYLAPTRRRSRKLTRGAEAETETAEAYPMIDDIKNVEEAPLDLYIALAGQGKRFP